MVQLAPKQWLTLGTAALGCWLAIAFGMRGFDRGLAPKASVSRRRPQVVEVAPPRDQIAAVQLDQSLVLTVDNGTVKTIAYSSVILDPRWIDLEYFAGWSRELEANGDRDALVFSPAPPLKRAIRKHPWEWCCMAISRPGIR